VIAVVAAVAVVVPRLDRDRKAPEQHLAVIVQEAVAGGQFLEAVLPTMMQELYVQWSSNLVVEIQ